MYCTVLEGHIGKSGITLVCSREDHSHLSEQDPVNNTQSMPGSSDEPAAKRWDPPRADDPSDGPDHERPLEGFHLTIGQLPVPA